MNAATHPSELAPAFCHGIQYFGAPWPGFAEYADVPAIAPGQTAISCGSGPAAVYQTLLAADALRYLTLQMCAAKASGHPGGFASAAEAYAALVMLGHTNIVTEVGHHAPGFYAAMFLDRSLEDMGIFTVQGLGERFRERHGLLGHLSGAIPGLLAPAGPLGQGQHFAMAGALLHPGRLFPVTIGDGGMGEPYVLNSMLHFNTAYPLVTNYLPVLVWNGYSQEHHAMCATWSNAEMTAYWKAHGFEQVFLVDAKSFDDRNEIGAYVDSTQFSFERRLAFAGAVLQAAEGAARSALSGRRSVLIVKQLKGSGVHKSGAKAHNLYPADTLAAEHIAGALQRRALAPEAWQVVRENFVRAGGGPAAKTVVTERELDIVPLPELPLQEFALGETQVPATAFGALAAFLGQVDPYFTVANADGNEASAMANINQALKIRHPLSDPLYHQAPAGQVYEPLNEDACAGLTAALALFGARSLWLSYESFAINGWPIVQTVVQAMAELRRKTPSVICMFTAGALEQGRNGWTHQRPEIENYFAAQMRNGNFYALFPCDANQIQAAYAWALETHNKGIVLIASKSPLPVRTTLEQARRGIERGAVELYDSPGVGRRVVFAVTGDLVLQPVFVAKDRLEAAGVQVRIVSVGNPRRLYRPTDVAWDTVVQPDGEFMDDAEFDTLFRGDVLLCVSGGPSGPLEPLLLRSRVPRRDVLAWKRGETTASAGELMAFNGLTAEAMAERALALLA